MRIALLAACVGLAACGGGSDSISYQDSEGKTRAVEVQDNGDTRTATTDDGLISGTGTQGGKNAKFPDYAPQYPGSEILTSVDLDLAGKKRQIITIKSADSPDKVMAYYQAELAKAGKQASDMSAGATRLISVGKLTDPELQISIDPDGSGSRFNLSVPSG